MGQARPDGENDLMAVGNARRLTGTWKPSASDGGVELEKNSFLNERTANVYENKGVRWRACQSNRYVSEKQALSHQIRESC
jgi:hypothetical protein